MKRFCSYHPAKWEAFAFLMIPVLVGILSATCFDNDVWFLIRTGEEIVTNGFPHVDFLTFHESLTLVVQQWLVDVSFFFVYDVGGKNGLYFLTLLVNIYLIFITYHLLMLVTDKKRNLSILFTCVITSSLAFFFLLPRPQIFSFAILITELYVLEHYMKKGNTKILYLLPFLSWLMIQVHASLWPMLFCFWLPFFLNTFSFSIGRLSSEAKPKKPLLLAFIFMILVALINPYGVDAIFYLFRSLNSRSLYHIVPEMRIPDIHTFMGIVSYFCLFVVWIGYFLFTKSKIKIRHFLLLLGTTYLTISSRRGLAYFLIAAIYPLAYYFRSNFYRVRDLPLSFRQSIPLLVAVLFLGIMPIGLILSSDGVLMKYSMQEGIDYLLENEDADQVRLYCAYGECTYAEYMGLKPYMDSRAEVFIKENNQQADILDEMFYLQNYALDYHDFLDKYQFTHLLVTEDDYLYQLLLHDSDYEVFFSGVESKTTHSLQEKNLRHYIIFKKR
jgi:hypothetical protein